MRYKIIFVETNNHDETKTQEFDIRKTEYDKIYNKIFRIKKVDANEK